MAATISRPLSHQMLSPPAAATRPAVIRSESPGRKKPTRSPVSVETIATKTTRPPERTRSSKRPDSRPAARSPRTSTRLLAPRDRTHLFARPGRGGRAPPDAHRVERAPDENDGDGEEGGGEEPGEAGALLGREPDGQLHREEPEERRELDDRAHRHGGRVLEGIADRVADDGRRVERRPLLL